MTRYGRPCAAVLLFVTSAYAEYNHFYFATPASDFLCESLGYPCVAPNLCAHENLLNITYCCTPGSQDAICWGGSQTCTGANKQPGTVQIACQTSGDPYCCLKDKETCTQRKDQINVCWGTQPNPVANLTVKLLNSTYSSASSKQPRASTFTVNVNALLGSQTASSRPASASASATSTGSVSATVSGTPAASSNSAGNNNTSSVSGGAIGGAVVGAVAGIALIGGGILYLMRRNKSKSAGVGGPGNELDADNPYNNQGYANIAQVPQTEREKFAQFQHEAPTEASPRLQPAATSPALHHYQQPVELPTYPLRLEMEANKPGVPSR